MSANNILFWLSKNTNVYLWQEDVRATAPALSPAVRTRSFRKLFQCQR